MSNNPKMKEVVIIGGGHGQSLICQSIKDIPDIHITAIVTVADDGGSTGRLRALFHLPAMGDIRNVLLALSDDQQGILTALMNYRFVEVDGSTNNETDVLGHNLGNLIFTALANTTHSFEESIRILSELLHTVGDVLPVTEQIVTLNALMEDGTRVRGEKNIPTMVNTISRVFYDVPVKANINAVNAILNADVIIYGIGSLYTSILPNVIIPEITDALVHCNAPKIYFCNAMTQPGETDGYTMEDHVHALESHHCPLDTVVMANDMIPDHIIGRYLDQHSIVVKATSAFHPYTLVQESLLRFDHDLVRHDPLKVKKVMEYLLNTVVQP